MMQFESKQKEKGITLVALVITVIVLLILAAVSMSLISGNGDLFGKANTAAETMKTAEKNEQNEYNNLMSFINTYYGQNGGNSGGAGGSGDTTQGGQSSQNGNTPAGGDTTTKYTVTYNTHGANETVAAETDKASGEKVTLPTVTKASSTFKGWYTAETEGTKVGGAGEEYTVTGTVTLHAQWEAITADPTGGIGAVNNTYKGDFGKIVTGTSVPTIDTVSTWRLFYADNDYVYLIGDSIGYYGLDNTDVVKGFGSSTISTLGRNLNSKFTNKSSWTLDSDNNGTRNENIQAVEALLDTTKWEDYKGTGAVWAIGAPTLEMFIASYNATHTKQIECDVAAGDIGYKVKWSSPDSSYDTDIENLGNSADIDKAIYAPGYGFWWLASPSARDSGYVMYVDSYGSGNLDDNGYSDYGGVRALVSYPISKINNGLTIENYYFVNNSGD